MKENEQIKNQQIRAAIDKLFPKLASGKLSYWYFIQPLEKEFNISFNDCETYAHFTPEEQKVLNHKYVGYQIIRLYWKFVTNPGLYLVKFLFADIHKILKTTITEDNFEIILKPYLPKRAITTIKKRMAKEKLPKY